MTFLFLKYTLFFHGGGWVYGNFPCDFMCRRIAKQSNSLVISVLYKLAPQFKYPIALEDCFDSLIWVNENAINLNANPQNIIFTGDSAGGNLATFLCLLTRDKKDIFIDKQINQPINLLILIYPVLDGTQSQPSMQFTDAPVITKESMQFFINSYAQNDSDIYQP